MIQYGVQANIPSLCVERFLRVIIIFVIIKLVILYGVKNVKRVELNYI